MMFYMDKSEWGGAVIWLSSCWIKDWQHRVWLLEGGCIIELCCEGVSEWVSVCVPVPPYL